MNDSIEETDELEELNLDEDTVETDTTDWKAEAEKAKAIARRYKTKLEKATKAPKVEEKTSEPVKKEATTGALDENALDFLDLKGITDQDEIDLIETVIAKTGQTVRQVLKDEYVSSKLDSMRAQRALKDAMPSNTKRGGGTTDNLEAAIAKFEKTGELPTDFEMRTKVVDGFVSKSNSNKPSWHS